MLSKRKGEGDGVAVSSKFKRVAGQASVPDLASRGRNCKIKVYVRARPLTHNEPNTEVVQIVDEQPTTSLIFDPKVHNDVFYFKGEIQTMRDINKKIKKNQLFEFDEVFPQTATNRQVFDSTAKCIVGSILEGFNCSVFAYGATGAGKTFTMLGKEDCPGISYLTIKELLDHIDASRETLKISISVSYIEVYNEEVRDLLNPSCRQLELREEGGGGTFISGLKLIPVTDVSQLFALLESGNKQRSQHPTDSNSESSRSHAIFQVRVRMQEKSVGGQVKVAKLTMIDLAGSERGCATGYKGKHFKEGSSINKSLLALGNCINALADGQKYVPYRDSKLTRILKDSLGGNCQTIMIANISPSQISFDETYNTLKYATRARTIVTTANQNFIRNNLSLSQYKQMVTELKTKLSKNEGEMSELTTWKTEVDRVMSQRVLLFTEIMALESQKKITEWRLNKAIISQNLNKLDYLPEKLGISIEQWRNRIETLQSHMEEYSNRIKSNMADTQRVHDRMTHICKHVSEASKETYKSIFSSWEDKVKIAILQVGTQHLMSLNRLLAKNDETLSSFRDESMPFLSYCYELLQAYNHVTMPMKSQYELTMKRLQGIKYVSWDETDEGDTNNEDNPRLAYYQQLVVPGQTNGLPIPAPEPVVQLHRGVVPAGGQVRSRLATPRSGDKRHTSPLRTLQPTSKPITKVIKSPKTKLKQHMISSLNKENIVKEPLKKKFYSETRSQSKKRTPFKSTSLINLQRTAI